MNITSPVAYRVFQRNAHNTAQVPVSAAAQASVRRLEAGVTDRKTGRTVVDWTALEDPRSGDEFSGVLEAPAGGVNYWQPGEPACPRLEHVLKALGSHGARAVLWHQGETDAINGMPADEYEQLLTNLIKLSREAGGYDIVWLVANASFCPDQWDAEPAKFKAIRKAQQALWRKGIALRGPDTDQLRDPKYRSGDRIHFSEFGLRVHAERWFDVIVEQLFE